MDSERFQRAIAAFDRENAADPTEVVLGGAARPRQLVEAERLSAWVERLDPHASEALLLAARCQHLRRWEIPRSDFPSGRVGYLQWRTRLARFHADEAENILRNVGYGDDDIARVRRINVKHGLRSEPDVQTMEDALCLTFLELDLEALSLKHDDAKIVDILRKTWRKMSPPGRLAALDLVPQLPQRLGKLVVRAVGTDG
jgi:hypothetical protein